jgi:acylphosphatase
MKRFHVVVEGLVQGVSFRARTKGTADSLGLKGWVRNLPGGNVEAVFEGDEENLKTMLAWCRKGPSLARVTDVKITEEPYEGNFNNFSIRY